MASFRTSSHNQNFNLPSSSQAPLARQRLLDRSSRGKPLRRPTYASKRRSTPHFATARAAADKKATAFTLFLDLPLELRESVWSMVPEPRLVTIAPKFDGHSSTWNIRPRAKQVQTLYVCQESRNQALRDYTLVTDGNIAGACMYVNWYRDRIFFDFPSADFPRLGSVLRFFTQRLCMVQSLALGLQWYFRSDLLDILSNFGQLQNLIFVSDAVRTQGRCGNGRLVIKEIGPLYPDVRYGIETNHTRWKCDNPDKIPLLRHVSMSMVKWDKS